MVADANDASSAFSAYASDQLWIASHLMQLFGVMLIVVALIQLSQVLKSGPARGWITLCTAGAIASLSATAALQAVDGVALKNMVDLWAAANEPEKTMLFQAAFGVRQIEIGLASITAVLFGLTVTLYGVALITDKTFPWWLGWLAILGGLPTAVAGIVMAYTGFSSLVMSINMPASSLLLLWLIILGVMMWRHSGRLENSGSA